MLIYIFLLTLTKIYSGKKNCLFDYKNNKINTNLFIGTDGHGHIYPGATLPFGMVQLSPDNGENGWDFCSGYHYSSNKIIGFSHTHLSGTGIGDLQDIRLFPTFNPNLLYSTFNHSQECAVPGYYYVHLNSGIEIQLTTSKRIGLHRYLFNAKFEENKNYIILDLKRQYHLHYRISSKINIKKENNIIEGYLQSRGWSNRITYFVISFSEPFEIISLSDQFACIQIFKNEIVIKTAISYVNLEGCYINLQEVQNKSFDDVKQNSIIIWNHELSKIKIETKNQDFKTIFYTALYHSFLGPTLYNDKNNKIMGIDKKIYDEPHDIYTTWSLWDTFRAQMPLLTITQRDKIKDMISSLMIYYNQMKKLPKWLLINTETNTMIGYHAIPVIVDAYLKNLTTFNFDTNKALKAMLQTAQKTTDNVFIETYQYLPKESIQESVSKGLEYAYDDWCIGQFALKIGNLNISKYFINRSKYYKNYYDKNIGFFHGRLRSGMFEKIFQPYDYTKDFTEGNAWQYLWFVPHDIKELIKIMNGSITFEKKLDQFFANEYTGKNKPPDVSDLIGQYSQSNEPSHHVAYLYNYIGKQWKTQQIVDKILQTQYKNNPSGIIGNDDYGQMSAWFVFSSMGFYPVDPISGRFEIGRPIFDKITINIEKNKTFIIRCYNQSAMNKYISKIFLNNKKLKRNFIYYHEIINGGILNFYMNNKRK